MMGFRPVKGWGGDIARRRRKVLGNTLLFQRKLEIFCLFAFFFFLLYFTPHVVLFLGGGVVIATMTPPLDSSLTFLFNIYAVVITLTYYTIR